MWGLKEGEQMEWKMVSLKVQTHSDWDTDVMSKGMLAGSWMTMTGTQEWVHI